MEQNEKEPFEELRDYLENRKKAEAAKPPSPKPGPEIPFTQRYPRLIAALSLALILASAFYIYSALSRDWGYLSPRPEPRPGSKLAKLTAGYCELNLLKMAAPGNKENLSCPLSGLDYVRENAKVVCPSPDRHWRKKFYAPLNSTYTVKIPL